MKIKIFPVLIAIAIIVSCSEKETTTNNTIDTDALLLPKKYDEVCFLMTHNSMNALEKGFSIPNQTFSVSNQLRSGVRGLMLDTYDGPNGVALTYHVSSAVGSEKLVDVMQEIKNFMILRPKAVISIIFQNDGSNAQLQQAIDSFGLDEMTYIHSGGAWPTIQTMVDNNTRLVLFVEQDKLPRASYLMYAWGTVFDTKYTYSNVSQFDCDVNRGGSGSKELFLINHWLGGFLNLPDSTLAPQSNRREVISNRVQDCSSANSHIVNYLGVDFYHIGAAKVVVDSINGI